MLNTSPDEGNFTMTSFGMLIHRLVYLICKLAIWTFEHFIVKTKGHRKKDKRTPQKGQKDTAKKTKGHRKKDKRTPQSSV